MLKLSEAEILALLDNPSYQKEVKNPTFRFQNTNPSCGDVVEGSLLFQDGLLVDAHVKPKGCVLSKVSSYLWLEHVMGKSKEEILAESDSKIFEIIGDVIPMRSNCALLTPFALKRTLNLGK